MSIEWVFLVAVGFVAVIAGFLASNTAGVVTGLAVIGFWICYANVASYLRGIRRHVERHFGPKFKQLESLTHRVPKRDCVGVHRAIEALRSATSPPQRVLGVPPMSLNVHPNIHADMEEDEYEGVYNFRLQHLVSTNYRPQALNYVRLPSGQNETTRVPSNALYLLRSKAGIPFAVLFQVGGIELLAPSADEAQQVLDELLEEAGRRSIYRGCVVSLRSENEGKSRNCSVEFHELPVVDRDSVILADNVLQLIERNVLGPLRNAETLRRAGCANRHGVLFHGPPGTGKSLVIRYLARSFPNLSVVLLTGRQLHLIRESCRLARLLAPSLVILEDVDLIATDREQSRDTTLLHDLMDEMDGLGPKAEITFLLTTNRPEVLERALTTRPGRIDQAIYFPLPDVECRRRLLRRFGRKIAIDSATEALLVEKTEGASPAFLEEVVRRAVLIAAENGETSDPLVVSDENANEAIRELLELGGSLTHSLFGLRAND